MPFVDELRKGADLVMGNRFKGGIEPGAMPPLHRYLGNPVLSFIGRLFFRSAIGDFHCGLRGFRRDARSALGLQTTGMEFASEMVVKATLAGQKITEVPDHAAQGRPQPPAAPAHLARRLAAPALPAAVQPALAVLHPRPGAARPRPRRSAPPSAPARSPSASVTFDVDTLVACGAMVVIGFQAVLFWLFTQVYAGAEGFLPNEPKVQKLLGKLSLERGLLARRRRLALAGLVGLVFSLDHWQRPRLRSPELRARAAADGAVGDRADRELPDHPRHVLPVHPGHQADQARSGRRDGGTQCQREHATARRL